MSPSPTPRHTIAAGELYRHLDAQLPPGLCAILDVDIDLGLAPAGQPGTSRRPDLVVVDRDAVGRVDREGGLLRASEVVLVVGIVAPGSRRTDNVVKRSEYADAGIRHSWIVDLDPPVSATVSHLAGGFGYQDSVALGELEAPEPFPARIELDSLG